MGRQESATRGWTALRTGSISGRPESRAHHRRGRAEAGRDVEVHQPAVEFVDRRAVLPSAQPALIVRPGFTRQSSVM